MAAAPAMDSALGDTSSVDNLESEYDIIIVGGGTAGSVLASRLSEDRTTSVLLVEAGSNRLGDPRIVAPGLAIATWSDPDFDWCFTTVPQESLKGRVVAWTSGKTLGGSSAINMGLIAFPYHADIDAWEKLGNPGWNWESLQAYYHKFHTFQPPSAEVRQKLGLDYLDDAAQGQSGPVKVGFGDFHGPLEIVWAATMKQMGLRAKKDHLSGLMVGGHNNPGATDATTLHRSHAAAAYLSKDVTERSNLRIITDALVQKIEWDRSAEGEGDVRASGVKFTSKSGETHVVKAKKEVILSCGTINSPRILELSGIGSSTVLQSHGIEVVVDNPGVGENLQDHILHVKSYEVADGVPSADAFRDPAVQQGAMELFMQGKPGPLSASTYESAFISSLETQEPQEREQQQQQEHDVKIDGIAANGTSTNTEKNNDPVSAGRSQQYALLAATLHSEGGDTSAGHFFASPAQTNLAAGPLPQQYLSPLKPENYLSIYTALSHPFSRGSTHISSADPAAKPAIDPRYLSHPQDRRIAACNVAFISKIAAAEPFRSTLLKPNGLRIPPLNPEAEEEIDLTLASTNFHYVGTCAMMPRAQGGVVDPHLKVYGVRGLRVVDASVVPLIPRGNLSSSVYAIAERAAEWIREDLKSSAVGGNGVS